MIWAGSYTHRTSCSILISERTRRSGCFLKRCVEGVLHKLLRWQAARDGSVRGGRSFSGFFAVLLSAFVLLSGVVGLDTGTPLPFSFEFGRVQAAGDSFRPTLSVYFFDVDQGDSTLLQGEDFTILIDAGRHDRDDVLSHLRRAGVETIDLFILTHPHADHIGQCPQVMQHFPVGEVWMSGDVHTTRTFERCLDAIIASDAGYHEPQAGETYRIGGARIEVLHPAAVTGDLNNGSVSVRIVYKQSAFVLTGDAEAGAELEMLARGHELRADVLKLAHHGSRTSSIPAFVERVAPTFAVYSAGLNNTYGHPHPETLRTAEAAGVTVFGTDVNGTVVMRTDGLHVEVEPERGGSLGSELERRVAGPLVQSEACQVGQVDINRASEGELTKIVHVGPAIASRIVAGRPFRTVNDLLRVSGIGEARLADIVKQGIACAGQ